MLATILTLTALAAPQDAATLEPFELTVRRAVLTPGIDLFEEPGVEIRAAARTPGRKILSIDKDASKVAGWTDDAGTDLSHGAPTDFFFWVDVESWGEPAEASIVKFKTETVPDARAQRITLKGTLGLVTASKTKQDTATVALEKGKQLEVAGLKLKLSDVEDQGGQVSLTIETSTPLDAIQEVTFADGAGKEIEAEDMGSGSFGFGGKFTYSKSWLLDRRAPKIELTVSYWSDLETTRVPIDMSLGAGF